MADIPKSTDEKSLERWLKDKPVEWAQLIALRSGLRVFPLAISKLTNAIEISVIVYQRLTLAVWRCLLISSVSSRYPTDEMKTVADAAAAWAAAASHAAAGRGDAAYDVAAVFAGIYAADAVGADAAAADAVDAGAAANLAAAAAAAAASATDVDVDDAETVTWEAIRCDCRILGRDGPQELVMAPLWLKHDQSQDHEPESIIATPEWAEKAATKLIVELTNLLGPDATLIADWYRPLLTNGQNANWSRKFLGDRARDLALKQGDFWEISKKRTAGQIMEDIAEALEWSVESSSALETSNVTGTIAETILAFLGRSKEAIKSSEIVEYVQSIRPEIKRKSVHDNLSRLAANNEIEKVSNALYRGIEGLSESVADFIVRFVESDAFPVSIDHIRAKFRRESYPYIDSTLRRELGKLAKTGRIQRVRRGWYTSADFIEETAHQDNEAPQSVEQGAGPKFGAAKGRLDRFPAPPSVDEESDPTLAKLLARIQKRLKSLRDAFQNDLVRYPQLEDTLSDYEEAVRPDKIGELDIDELWISGAGLIAQARAFAALDPSKQVTEPLEPQQQALLGEIARLHGALIMGFAKGRELAEKSGLPLLTPDEFRALLEHERTIVRWLLETDHYEMSDQVRSFLESVDHTLLSASEGAEQLAILGYPTVRNLLIFSANALGFVERQAGRFALTGVPVHLAVNGMLYFFRENLGPILAFANSIPELRAYLEYQLVRLEIDWQKKHADDEDWED